MKLRQRHRQRLQIVASILSVAEKGYRKTRMMREANLNHRTLNRYLSEILNSGLASMEGDCCRLTGRGRDFLARYGEYAELCRRLEDFLGEVRIRRMALEDFLACSKASKDSAS